MKLATTCSDPHPSSLWTTTDVARFIGCSERQIYVLRKSGLPCVHVGGMVRFDPQQVKDWLGGNQETPKDERARQLSDVAASGDADNAECAAADLAREFPPKP